MIGVNSISNNAKKFLLNQLTSHTYQLTILNIQLESAGLYKCQNFTAKEENHFQIHVLGKEWTDQSKHLLLQLRKNEAA